MAEPFARLQGGVEVAVVVGRSAVRVEHRGALIEVPVVTVSAEPGPVVAVTANVHGDECTGVLAAQVLAEALGSELVRGTVHLYPSLNPQGLRDGVRGAGPDNVDLNRQFPGGSGTDVATRLASAVWRDVVARRPELLVDLHADSSHAIPYAIVDRPVRLTGGPRRRLEDRLLALAEATGLTVLREYPDEVYLRFGLDRSLAGAMVNYLHLPAVTIEAGPRRVIDPVAVDGMVRAVLRLLASQKMVDPQPPASVRVDGGPWRRASGPRTRNDGVLQPLLRAGETFDRGARLAVVRGVDGATLEDVVAPSPGIVVSWVDGCWIAAGTVVATLGVPDE